MAMEARCYRGGDGRTKMKPLVYKKRDAFGYLILFSFVGISIFLGRWHVISDFFNSLYVNYILK
jgi:energy-coupling factor transport system permease protein